MSRPSTLTHYFYLLLLLCSTAKLTAQCGATADAGPDQAVCFPGDVVVLQGNFMGTSYGFSWSPTLGLSNPNSLNPSASVSNNFTYTLTVFGESTSNPNLVANGDFEAGPGGFSSDYTFVSPGNPFGLAAPGNYTITTSPSLVFSNFPPCDDHTYGNGTGNLMVVNGGSAPGTQTWCQTVAVTPNTYYVFSAFAASVHAFFPGQLQLSINGSNVGNALNLPASICGWTGMTEVWFSGSSSSANLCILDMGTGSGLLANDYMLDDISFVEACRSTDDVEVVLLEAEAMVAAPFVTIPCEGDCVLLNGGGSSMGSGITYQWSASGNGVIQSGETSLTPEVCADGTYTLLVTNSLNGVSCNSSPVSVTVNVLESLPDFPAIAGLDEVCDGAIELYNVLTATAGTTYNWSVGGGQIQSGQGSGQVEINWLGTGSGTLCVTGENTCGRSNEACFTVNLTEGPSSSLDTTLCEGDSVVINGRAYGGSVLTGMEVYTQNSGCDSTVTINVSKRPPQEFTYLRYICEGDSIFVEGGYHFDSGTFVDTFANRHGCDSIIITQLEVYGSNSTEPPAVQCAATACNNLVNAGPDFTFCSPVPPVQLAGSVSGNASNISWTPTTGLSDPFSLTPTATVSTTTTYTLSATVKSANLVTNGDFESGPIGFSTDYTIGTSSCFGLGFLDCEGSYGVLSNPNDGHANFSACSDVSGGGSMMVVNGAAALQNVWCQTINVNANTDYDFSAWLTSVHPASPAILQFSINGATIGAPFNAGAPCAWGQFSASWNSGGNTSATICILNQNTASGGNDFAIDNISFNEVCEGMDEMTIYVVDLMPVIATPDLIDCNDPFGCVLLDATGTTTNGNNLTFQWTTAGSGMIQSGANTPTPTVCAAGIYNLEVTAELNGMICTENTSIQVFDNNQPPPDPTIFGPQSLCVGTTASYSIFTDPSYTSYDWQVISGGILQTGQGTNMVTVEWTAPNGAQLCVLVTNLCGEIGSNCITLSAPDTLVTPVIDGLDLICDNDTLQSYHTTLQDTLVNSVVWTIPGDAQLLDGQGTDSISINWSGSAGGQVCVQLNATCDTAQQCITVSFSQTPTTPDISGPQSLCEGVLDTVLYTVSNTIATDTLNWTFPIEATLIAGQGNDSLYLSWTSGPGGQVCLSNTNECGESNACISVVIQSEVTGTFDTTLCDANTFTYNGTIYGNGNWGGVEMFTAQGGCDSLVTVTITQAFSETIQIFETDCDPANVGITNVVHQNAAGCDSIVITETTLLASDTTEIFDMDCDPANVGITSAIYPNAAGCDSLVITEITLSASDTTEIFDTDCDPANVGITSAIFPNAAGCDSLVITEITLSASDTTEIFDTDCDLANVGITSVIYPNAAGCDSLVITEITYSASDTTEIFDTDCDLTNVGITSVVYPNAAGCDSLVITEITYSASDTTEIFDMDCDPANVGITSVVYPNAAGCDSLVITEIALSASDTTEIFDTDCDPANVGITSAIFPNAAGCDSLVITEITLLASDTTEIFDTDCDLANVGITSVVYPNAAGCDSLVITEITYSASDTTEIFDTDCDLANVGITSVVYPNAAGCDSLVITEITYSASDTTEIFDTDCDLANVGITSVVYPNAAGCDSLVITEITYSASDTTEIFDTDCDLANVGITSVVYPNAAGCDSLVITEITYSASDTTEIFDTDCDPANVGITSIVYPNAAGCDSLVITEIMLSASDTTEIFDTDCDPANVGITSFVYPNAVGCDSLVITEVTLLTSDTTEVFDTDCDPANVGITSVVYPNAAGCDSLVITEITLLASDTTEIFDTDCDLANVGITSVVYPNAAGCDSLVITEITYSASDTTEIFGTDCDPANVGITNVVYPNAAGCDSLVITEITLLASDTTEIFDTDCDPANVGITSVVYPNAAGCDSLVITEVTLLASDTTEVFGTDCDPANVGITSIVYPNAAGCDSLVITEVTLLASDTTEVFGTDCDPANVGITSIVYPNAAGCDSLVITEVTLLASDTTEVFGTDCDPANVGITSIVYPNAAGCDSLVITEITLLASDTTELFDRSCDPMAIGTSSVVLPNAAGCDSLIITYTTLLPPDSCGIQALLAGDTIGCNESTGSLELLANLGEAPFDYQWEGDGINPLGQGTINGLNVSETISGLEAGNYTVTITSAGGFTQVLNAVIIADPPLAITTQISTDYNGQDVSCFGAVDGSAMAEPLSGGTAPFSYTWSNGQQSAVTTGLAAGWHFVSVSDSEGCMAIDSVLLTEPEPLILQPLLSDVNCFDSEDGWLAIEAINGGTGPFQYALNNNPFQTDSLFVGLGAGLYHVLVQDANGCEATESFAINAPVPIDVALGQDTTIQLGDSILLQAAFNVPQVVLESLVWTNVNCSGCPAVTVMPIATTSYVVSITDEQGCSDSDDITIDVKRDRNVFIPNIFSPNGDGMNDRFIIFSGVGVKQINSFQVYSRWGEKVYEANNFQPNDPAFGWNGLFKGEALNPAVFVYWAQIEFEDGEIILYKGDVTLMK